MYLAMHVGLVPRWGVSIKLRRHLYCHKKIRGEEFSVLALLFFLGDDATATYSSFLHIHKRHKNHVPDTIINLHKRRQEKNNATAAMDVRQ